MILTLDPNKCTYNFWVNASVTDTDELGITTDGDAGSMQSEDKPLSNYDTALGGSGEFPAHSSVYEMQPYNGRDSFKAQEIVLIASENGGGIAYVTWSFTPGP
jgi:hypothetical protein